MITLMGKMYLKCLGPTHMLTSGGISSNHLLNLRSHSQCGMSDTALTQVVCNPSPAGHRRRRGINLICSHYKMNLALERRDPSTRQPLREMMKCSSAPPGHCRLARRPRSWQNTVHKRCSVCLARVSMRTGRVRAAHHVLGTASVGE